MGTFGVVALAAACVAGALTPMAVPQLPAIIGGVVGIGARSPAVVVVAAFLLCGARADAAWQALEAPMPVEASGTAVLRTDPERQGGSTTVVMSIEGRNVFATGWGPAGAALGRAQAGDRVEIAGRTRPWDTATAQRRASLRTAHRLTIESITVVGSDGIHWRVANAIRGVIRRGASPLDDQRRALFTGLVYGDDRGQSPVTAADFRLAGLTHLLAVSGQNVAAVLLLLRPALARLALPSRWMVTLVVLALFATATRFEPSVLRATTMAEVATTGTLLGAATNGSRMLALAVTALVIHDPLLAMSIGFQLSVAATAGIIVLQAPIAHRLGNGAVAQALAVTLAAQLAVAPLLIHTFGPVSLVSIPANLLAGPAAGLVMLWGLTGGTAAGLIGGLPAELLHQPTTAGLWWLESTAHAAAAVPIAPVGLVWIGAASMTWLAWTRSTRAAARLCTVASIVALAVALVPSTPVGDHRVGAGSRIEIGGSWRVLVLEGRSDPASLLEDLRRLGVRRIDLAIIDEDRDRSDLDALTTRVDVDHVAAIDASDDIGDPMTLALPSVDVAVVAGIDGIEVDIRPSPGRPQG